MMSFFLLPLPFLCCQPCVDPYCCLDCSDRTQIYCQKQWPSVLVWLEGVKETREMLTFFYVFILVYFIVESKFCFLPLFPRLFHTFCSSRCFVSSLIFLFFVPKYSLNICCLSFYFLLLFYFLSFAFSYLSSHFPVCIHQYCEMMLHPPPAD